jgi:flagellar hook-basal body complex protein FliE
MDIRTSLAALTYAAARPATEPKSAPGGPLEGFTSVAASFAETLERGESTARAAMVGQADPHALVTALAESQLAIETAATVRDRVVEAYQEILRMQV